MLDYIVDHLLEIIAIVAAFFIFYLQLRRKALSYRVITDAQVVSVSDKVKGNIQILYDGKPVPGLRLIELRIQNTGNLPIRPDDYIQPLTVLCRSASVIIVSTELVDTHSLGAHIEEVVGLEDIVISKPLLNPKDYFDLRILTTGVEEPYIAVVGRIVGVSKIQEVTSLSAKQTLITLLVFFVGFLTTIILAIIYNLWQSSQLSFAVLMGLILALFVNSILWLSRILRLKDD
jgi:hypothetical protein